MQQELGVLREQHAVHEAARREGAAIEQWQQQARQQQQEAQAQRAQQAHGAAIIEQWQRLQHGHTQPAILAAQRAAQQQTLPRAGPATALEQAADALDKLNKTSSAVQVEVREAALGWLRQYSARGTRELVTLMQLNAAAPLAKLFDCNHATLHADACATLVNLTLYPGARSAVLKTNAVETAAKALMGTQAQQSAALALLQNLSLSRAAHERVISSGFLQQLPEITHPSQPPSTRVRALATVEHLASVGENMGALLHMRAINLAIRELAIKPGDTDCQKRALGILLNMSYAEPCFSIGSRPKPHSSHPCPLYTGTAGPKTRARCSSCRRTRRSRRRASACARRRRSSRG